MLFVVTNPQNGWDCVSGTIYEADNEEQVLQHIADERGITLEELEDNNDTIVHETYDITKLN
jgi:hypothetical protein